MSVDAARHCTLRHRRAEHRVQRFSDHSAQAGRFIAKRSDVRASHELRSVVQGQGAWMARGKRRSLGTPAAPLFV